MKIFYSIGLISLLLFSCTKDQPASPQLPEPEYGTVTDVEGNVYKTVKIGDQWWMAENLRTTILNDANNTPIPLITDANTWATNNIPMVSIYDNKINDPVFFEKYGILYNWYSVNTGKLAPTGWHVPTDAEWQKLQDYLIANGYNYDGTKTENKIAKALAATSDWTPAQNNLNAGSPSNDMAANNKSGFNAIPSGMRDDLGAYNSLNEMALYWSASQNANPNWNCNFWFIREIDINLINGLDNASTGYAVRCVKD